MFCLALSVYLLLAVHLTNDCCDIAVDYAHQDYGAYDPLNSFTLSAQQALEEHVLFRQSVCDELLAWTALPGGKPLLEAYPPVEKKKDGREGEGGRWGDGCGGGDWVWNGFRTTLEARGLPLPAKYRRFLTSPSST